jgi:hypothetical protein
MEHEDVVFSPCLEELVQIALVFGNFDKLDPAFASSATSRAKSAAPWTMQLLASCCALDGPYEAEVVLPWLAGLDDQQDEAWPALLNTFAREWFHRVHTTLAHQKPLLSKAITAMSPLERIQLSNFCNSVVTAFRAFSQLLATHSANPLIAPSLETFFSALSLVQLHLPPDPPVTLESFVHPLFAQTVLDNFASSARSLDRMESPSDGSSLAHLSVRSLSVVVHAIPSALPRLLETLFYTNTNTTSHQGVSTGLSASFHRPTAPPNLTENTKSKTHSHYGGCNSSGAQLLPPEWPWPNEAHSVSDLIHSEPTFARRYCLWLARILAETGFHAATLTAHASIAGKRPAHARLFPALLLSSVAARFSPPQPPEGQCCAGEALNVIAMLVQQLTELLSRVVAHCDERLAHDLAVALRAAQAAIKTVAMATAAGDVRRIATPTALVTPIDAESEDVPLLKVALTLALFDQCCWLGPLLRLALPNASGRQPSVALITSTACLLAAALHSRHCDCATMLLPRLLGFAAPLPQSHSAPKTSCQPAASADVMAWPGANITLLQTSLQERISALREFVAQACPCGAAWLLALECWRVHHDGGSPAGMNGEFSASQQCVSLSTAEMVGLAVGNEDRMAQMTRWASAVLAGLGCAGCGACSAASTAAGCDCPAARAHRALLSLCRSVTGLSERE